MTKMCVQQSKVCSISTYFILHHPTMNCYVARSALRKHKYAIGQSGKSNWVEFREEGAVSYSPSVGVSRRTMQNRRARRRCKHAKRRTRIALKNAMLSEPGADARSTSAGKECAVETESGPVVDDEEEEMEISEEVLDFFAHTHKHRMERGW